MERIGFLINKLREQYEKADSQGNMLVTLQMLYRELMPKTEGSHAPGKISVVVPGQMDLTFLEKSMGQKLALNLTPNTEGKQVFELSAESTDVAEPAEIQPVVTAKPAEPQPGIETKPAPKPIVAMVEPPKNPFVIAAPRVEIPVSKPDPVAFENLEETLPGPPKPVIPDEANARFMPIELKPHVEPSIVQAHISVTPPAPKAPVPPREVHESIQVDAQPSLNDKAEKGQPELFKVLKAEPLKDLKKAISINERFQYINHLFMKDETMYERSLKTINSFNVFSEAQFWIRKELATKLGWSDDDEMVQQFMHLVERRFS